MTIINTTRKETLANKHKTCKSILCMARGLMFHNKISDYGLIFDFKTPEKPSMHNFFVFYPIDILFLDENFKVVDLKEDFKPFTPYLRPKKTCRYVIEFPAKTISKSKTCIGDNIKIETK